MRLVIQRVTEAKLYINGSVYSEVEKGLLVFIGVSEHDSAEDVNWLANKLVSMRIFSDEAGKMNLCVKDINGAIMIVSQFTLHASTAKGNRPSFISAAKPEKAIPLYEMFIKTVEALSGKKAETGQFGADMKIALVNDGPVTIIIDSANKE